MPDAETPLQVPAFRQWMGLRACTMIAGQIQLTATGWVVWHATGRTLDLAWVGLAQFLPVLLLALPAGQLADVVDRRKVMAGAYAVQVAVSATFAALAWHGQVSTAEVWALCLAMGTARAFGNPAGQALLPALVPAGVLPRALALSASLWQFASVVGPSLGGAAIAWFGGAHAAFGFAAALQLVGMALVLRLPAGVARLAPRGFGWDTLLAGARYVRDQRIILACTTLDLFAVLLGGATALLPVYASDILHVGPTGYGILRAGPALGAGVVALWLGWHPLERRAGPRMLLAVAAFGVFTLVFGCSERFPLSFAALVALGAADMISVVVRQTLVQVFTPDEMRGRVSAVNQVFIGASNELGEFEFGLAAAWLGPVGAVVAGGFGTLAVVALWAWWFPELRRVDRLDPR